jgi:hypothetical protein
LLRLGFLGFRPGFSGKISRSIILLMLSSLPANRALVVSFWVKENLRFSGMGCLTGSVLCCHIHFSSKMNQDAKAFSVGTVMV